jgi:hypothetical protein
LESDKPCCLEQIILLNDVVASLILRVPRRKVAPTYLFGGGIKEGVWV